MMRLLRLLGVILFFCLLSFVNWQEMISLFKNIRTNYLLGYFLLYATFVLLRIFRFKYLVNEFGDPCDFKKAYLITVDSSLLGTVTPGRVGELVKLEHLRRHNVLLPRGISIVFIDRIFDVLLLASFAGLGVLTYLHTQISRSLLLYAFAILLLAITLLLFRKAIFNRLKNLVPDKWRHFIINNKYEFLDVCKRSWKKVFLYSLCIFIVNLLHIYYLALAFNFKLSFLYVSFSYAIATLVVLLPVSINGLGTREAAYILLFKLQGITASQALSFSLFDGVLFANLSVLLMLLPLWGAKLFSFSLKYKNT